MCYAYNVAEFAHSSDHVHRAYHTLATYHIITMSLCHFEKAPHTNFYDLTRLFFPDYNKGHLLNFS